MSHADRDIAHSDLIKLDLATTVRSLSSFERASGLRDLALLLHCAVRRHKPLYPLRFAASAASASSMRTSTIPVFLLVPGSRKSPSFAKLTTDATAPPCCMEVGRIMATGPSFGSRNTVGSGMIKFVWNSSAMVEPVAPVLGSTALLRFGNVRSPSVMLGALPALSCQV